MRDGKVGYSVDSASPGVGARRSAAQADVPRWRERERRSACRFERSPLLAPASAALLALASAGPCLAEPHWTPPQWPRSVWTHLAGDASRTGVTAGGTLNLAAPSWVVTHDMSGKPITFVGQSSPVVTRDLVLAIGTVDDEGYAYLFAVDRRSAKIVWQSFVDLPEGSSYSSPAIDERGRSVVVATGYGVKAFDLPSGVLLWDLALPNPVVNASPAVTQDLWPTNRAFITDSDPYGTGGRLYCINISPRLAPINPHGLGDVVWSAEIGGTSGNTPAYQSGRVYVTTVGDFIAFPPVAARVMAFDARARTAPAPLWTYSNTADPAARFFGGLGVVDGSVYAATYDFNAAPPGINNSNLVKLSAATGALQWSVACNRTNSIPIVVGPAPGSTASRVLLSAGLHGFAGTVPSLQLFEDGGASARMVWDSASATWMDLNHNGRMDPGEYTPLAGWTHQPAVSSSLGGVTGFVGTLPAGGNGTTFPACVKLSAVDLDVNPGAPGFVRGQFEGAGSSPALADENVYTIGAEGLYAFGPAPFQYDVNGDGEVSMEDLMAWEQGQGDLDVDLDGIVVEWDREALVAELVRLGL